MHPFFSFFSKLGDSLTSDLNENNLFQPTSTCFIYYFEVPALNNAENHFKEWFKESLEILGTARAGLFELTHHEQ